jgi:hypothetical protein
MHIDALSVLIRGILQSATVIKINGLGEKWECQMGEQFGMHMFSGFHAM